MTAITMLDMPRRRQLAAGRWALARIEAQRAVMNPFFIGGLVLSGLLLYVGLSAPEDWSSGHYDEAFVSVMPLFVGSIAAANLIALRAPVHEVFGGALPLDVDRRRQGQLLAGLAPTAVVGVVVTVLGVIAWAVGGDTIGDVNPREVLWSIPELAQNVLLVAFAWAFGSALAKLVPSRLVGLVAAFFVGIVFVGASWIFASLPVALVQLQPFEVDLSATFEPASAPASWILVQPEEVGDGWQRMVLSPSAAAAHDLYLVGLILAVSAVVWTGRRRWQLLGAGIALVVAGVAWQLMVLPS